LQREPSVSPIVVEPNSTKTGGNQIEQASVNANSYPPSLATDIKAKCRFLGELGLELVTAECRRRESHFNHLKQSFESAPLN
jgi:hypothetical protein